MESVLVKALFPNDSIRHTFLRAVGANAARAAIAAALPTGALTSTQAMAQEGGALDKKPSQLFGGTKQRLGIARDFAIQPKMLLLDEPFGALDALTRGTIQDQLITHDVDEAILLADRILLMRKGVDVAGTYLP
jgi:ABC-type nitrate/sulfonate/bicarbonate transport system ATPase subunit